MVREYKEVQSTGKKEREFGTGAVRDNADDKPAFHLLPPFAMERLAIHFANGAKRYDARNWEKGIPTEEFFASALRHLNKFYQGANDEDHITAALWNIACLIDTLERIELGLLPKELDNMPYYVQQEVK